MKLEAITALRAVPAPGAWAAGFEVGVGEGRYGGWLKSGVPFGRHATGRSYAEAGHPEPALGNVGPAGIRFD
jgi:hypothetical protein